tara:strand:+ start:13273 stop:14067 length:795 start_codon:yes stop_codon:yes gene_type:complete
MIFRIESKLITKALEDIQGKGMYLGDGGLSNSRLGEYVLMQLENDTLTLWNGDTTFGLTLTLPVEETIEEGTFIGSAATIIPYLKKFNGIVTLNYTDFLAVSSGNKSASIPAAVNHPNIDAIERIKQMVDGVAFEPVINNLWKFGSSNFEGAFQVPDTLFDEAVSGCELVKSGVYLLNYLPTDNEVNVHSTLQISSENGIANRYEQVLHPTQSIGDAATLQYSGPLHKFLKGQGLLNFYVKDEFPLLIVGPNKMVVKAPFTGGN